MTKWSRLQEEIFSFARERNDNLLIQAVAGSGKTTTIIESLNHLSGSYLFLAFNADIAEALRVKTGLSKQIVRTINSLGHRLWFKYLREAKLEPKKSYLILKSLIGEGSQVFKEFSGLISRLVGLGKAHGLGLDHNPLKVEQFLELSDQFSLDLPMGREEEISDLARRVFIQAVGRTDIFDFDDQIYGPLYHKWEFPHFSNLIIDEAQDLNEIQHLFITKLVNKGARLIAVGDRRQAIYGFRGALSNSMGILGSRFAMTELPLSITYRCPKSVVEWAQKYCPEITAREGAPKGEVVITPPDNFAPSDFGDQMVLCRNNAPMFKVILSYIRAKRPCQVRTNFLDNFTNWIRGFKLQMTSELIPKLDSWFARKSTEAREEGFMAKLHYLQDRYETAREVASEFTKVEDMLSMLKRLGESQNGTIFSTIHKAKGLEHPRVYILRPDLIPAIFARSLEQVEQEENLMYVGITRAADRLTFGATQ